MDTVWDALSKACDENEVKLRNLEKCSRTLPKEPRSWFYLKSDLLCPPLCSSDSGRDVQSMDDADSFVTVFHQTEPVNDQRVSSNVGAEKCEKDDTTRASQVTELHDKDLEAVLGDPNFPESVMKVIKRKEFEPSKMLSETDTVSFCRFLLDSEMYISEVTGTRLFNLILYPVICNDQKMFLSVLLLQIIRELANKFPVFMMNGVVIPAVARDDLEKQELDIICDILSGLNEDNLNTTLKNFLTSLRRSDDSSMKLLASVFKKKPKLDNEMAFVLVAKLQMLSDQFSSSIQLGKLLLDVIPLLNHKLSESSLKILKDVLDHHTTFLKTSALKLFNNLTHT